MSFQSLWRLKYFKNTSSSGSHDEPAIKTFDMFSVNFSTIGSCLLASSIYHYATISYVGGGFGVGIHNVLEAAVWDIPVIFGPNNKRFQEAQGLIMAGGGFEINDYQSFRDLMMRFETDEMFLQTSKKHAGEFVKGRAGATEKIMRSFPL